MYIWDYNYNINYNAGLRGYCFAIRRLTRCSAADEEGFLSFWVNFWISVDLKKKKKNLQYGL